MARSWRPCVIMGAHERLPFCSLFLLMNKGVECILTFRPFGRFPTAVKSQDTKNKSAAQSVQGSSYFQTDVRQALPLFLHPGRDPGLVSALVFSRHIIKMTLLLQCCKVLLGSKAPPKESSPGESVAPQESAVSARLSLLPVILLYIAGRYVGRSERKSSAQSCPQYISPRTRG